MATGVRCPQCERNALTCRYIGDVGGVEYLDLYEAYCHACGFKEIRLVNGGSPLGENWKTICPYCGEGHLTEEQNSE